MVRAVSKVVLFCCMFLLAGLLEAKTLQIPEWYRLNARLTHGLEVGKTVELVVNLESLVGDLLNTELRIFLPANWRADKTSGAMPLVVAGKAGEYKFTLTPTDYLSQGSIVVQADIRVPREALIAKVQKEHPQNAKDMATSINTWPAVSKRYTDVSFALYPEESFYPLTSHIWLSYDEALAPREGFRGPAYYEDNLISPHQAQTDVDMYEKLAALMNTDAELESSLSKSGIDLAKKQMDHAMGLYVLATKAYKAATYNEALDFLDLLLGKMPAKGLAYESVRIAALNLRGLVLWAQGQRRLAEESLKKAFYVNRKHPLQRYVLRNMGLLMVLRRDDVTAEQMYKLALSYKADYTLAKQEYSILFKQK